jgi:CubicO group peptidase (beta-lactamase class C family)
VRPPLVAAVAITAISAVACPLVRAQQLERADSVVRAWVDAGRIPGAVLHISDRGGRILSRAYGWAQTHEYGAGQYPLSPDSRAPGGPVALLDPVPMTMETVFDLASVTKVMATTMAVMLLADRGALTLDAPVSRYLPDFTEDGKQEITLEHLLTHRSGLSQWQPVYYQASTPTEAYAFIRDFPLAWAVGAERHYSDLGFMLLGLIVERVTGLTLDGVLGAELYEPLGLRNTGYRGERVEREWPREPRFAATSHGNPFEHRMVYDLDFGYRIEGDPERWDAWRRYTLVGEVNDANAHHAFGGVAGHAGLFSTAPELARLLHLLLRGGELGGRLYFRLGTVERFLTSTGDGQALGWQIPAYAPATAFGHTGFTGTFVLADRASGLAIVLLTNRQNRGVDTDTSYPDVSRLQRDVALAVIGHR